MSDFIAASSINNQYLADRLSYQRSPKPGEEQFGAITPELVREAWLRWITTTLMVLLVPLAIVGAQVATGDGEISSRLPDVGTAIGLYVVCVIVAGFAPLRRLVAMWDLLVDDAAHAADSSYAKISQSLLQRETPAEVSPIRVRNPYSHGSSNLLRISIPQFEVWVCVFPFGKDLFVGWSMVRTNRVAALMWRYVYERVMALVGKSSSLHFQLAANRARAVRDAVHNSVRQGVELAIAGGEGPSVAEVFGFDVPVQSGGGQTQTRPLAPVPTRPPAMPPVPTSSAASPPSVAPVRGAEPYKSAPPPSPRRSGH